MIDPRLRRKQIITFIIITVLLLFVCALSVSTGEYKIPMDRFFKTLFGFGEYTDQLILMEFRFPRMIITILAGAALSMSGAIIQSVTKNPIAEPGILGINAGGGFAIAIFVSIGQVDPDNFIYVLPLISIIGGVATALLIFSFSLNKRDGITPSSMV
ncbi:MAG: iron ABC transporter permease, partial [Staphylococcus lugdunensis]|nr:iron ABC transporter permease [Staphylococcus lugdunensis]